MKYTTKGYQVLRSHDKFLQIMHSNVLLTQVCTLW